MSPLPNGPETFGHTVPKLGQVRLGCRGAAGQTLHKYIMTSQVLQTSLPGDVSSKGRIVQGPRPSIAASSKGRIVYGTGNPRHFVWRHIVIDI